jgi:hypothetical protein
MSVSEVLGQLDADLRISAWLKSILMPLVCRGSVANKDPLPVADRPGFRSGVRRKSRLRFSCPNDSLVSHANRAISFRGFGLLFPDPDLGFRAILHQLVFDRID